MTFVILLDVKGCFVGSEVFWYAVKMSNPSITNAQSKYIKKERENKFLGSKVLDSMLINTFLNGIGSKRKGRNENETSHGLANNWY